MRSYLFVGLVVSLFFIVFIMQNTSPVVAHFLVWQLQGSLAVVILLSFFVGIIVSLLLAVPVVVKRKKKQSSLGPTPSSSL